MFHAAPHRTSDRDLGPVRRSARLFAGRARAAGALLLAAGTLLPTSWMGVGMVATAAASEVEAAGAELPRRVTIGLALGPDGRVATVSPEGAAAKAGVQVGDQLLRVGDVVITKTADLVEAMRRYRGGAEMTLVGSRAAKDAAPGAEPERLELAARLEPAPSEVVPGSKVSYGAATLPDGTRLRTILTVPEGPAPAEGSPEAPRPAFFFIQGIYCGSVDRPSVTEAADTRLITAMAQAGFVTLRVDKSGLGDSEGPPCGDIDFATELAGYQAALETLRNDPRVDPTRIYVFGHSMGGVMAPLLSPSDPPAGLIVYGTLGKTWFEYTLENVRRQSELFGISPADVADAIQRESFIGSVVYIQKKTVGDAWALKPEWKEPNPMLEAERIATRHVRFFHQLQDINIARAWQDSPSPMLAIHGEYDWVAGREDHEIIVGVANQAREGSATLVDLPGLDHGLTKHQSLQSSLAGMGRGAWDSALPEAILSWIRGLEGARPTP